MLNPQTKQDDIHNCQIVIDTLANKILHTSLSHITGKDVVEGDRTSVANLLEILTGLLEFLTEKIECEQEEEGNVNLKNKRNFKTKKILEHFILTSSNCRSVIEYICNLGREFTNFNNAKSNFP